MGPLQSIVSRLVRFSPVVLALVVTPSGLSASFGTTVSVPEPASALLVATGIAGLVLEARRRRK